MEKTLIAIVGPTAAGKTTWAIRLAKYFVTDIISADSRQFYKEMTIGTAVPSPHELSQVTHHFIQHISIFDPWSVGDFEKAATGLLEQLFEKKDIVIVVGGSGLYIKALAEGLDDFPKVDPSIRQNLIQQFNKEGLAFLKAQLKKVDPDYYEMVDLQNPHRLIRALEVFRASQQPYSFYLGKPRTKRPFNTIYLGIGANRSDLYQKIEQRVDSMMETGLLDEVRELVDHKELAALQTVGYQELFNFLEGQWDLESAVSEIKKNTRRYAKRQMTWLRKNKSIIWIEYDDQLTDVIDKMELSKAKENNV